MSGQVNKNQTVNISINVDYIQGKFFSNINRRELNVTPM